MNEGVFRSPKWMRNFADFEINTGEDIKGEKSKHQIKRDKKEAEEKRLKEWDRKWKETDEDQFRKFMLEEYNDFRGSSLKDFANFFRGDDSVWTKYEKWAKRTEEEKMMMRELTDILNEMNHDWYRNGHNYKDRIQQSYEGTMMVCKYTLIKRSKWKIPSKDIVMKLEKDGDGSYSGKSKMYITFDAYWGSHRSSTMTLTLNGLIVAQFVSFINNVLNTGKDRPSSNSSNGSSRTYSRPSSKSSDPKRNLYDTMVSTQKLREEQLRKMKANDPERAAMQNELNVLNTKIKSMKDRYKFEHLCGFHGFKVNESITPDKFERHFGISREMVGDLLFDITDDYPGINWWVVGSSESYLIEPNGDAFAIFFESTGETLEKENLYGFEKEVHKHMKELNSHLSGYGLRIHTMDFSETDTMYEIIVCKSDKMRSIVNKLHRPN